MPPTLGFEPERRWRSEAAFAVSPEFRDESGKSPVSLTLAAHWESDDPRSGHNAVTKLLGRLTPLAMISQQDITEARIVSVRVGDFDDAAAFDSYMLDSFENDHGFLVNEKVAPEISEPTGQLSDIRALLTGFSWYEDWIVEAVRLCQDRGCPAAKMAAVFLHLRYRPELCRNPRAPFRIVTNVEWIPTTLSTEPCAAAPPRWAVG